MGASVEVSGGWHYRDIGARFIAANTHPTATRSRRAAGPARRRSRRRSRRRFSTCLLLARASGLLKLGTVSIKPAPARAGGTGIDANASKIRLVRYGRAQALRATPAAGIAELTPRAEAADTEDSDPQALPARIARRLAIKAKLESEDGKSRCRKRKQTVESVFGIIKSAIGCARLPLRGRDKVADPGF